MVEEQKFKRHTAKLCSIKHLLSGKYVVQEGWKPNFIQTKSQKFVRVNIIGFVVDKPSPFQFILDDGSSSILVIDFNHFKKTADIKVGEPVLIIAKPRKSDEGLFLSLEIINNSQIKKNPSLIVKRKEDLADLNLDSVVGVDETSINESDDDSDDNSHETVSTFNSEDKITGDDIIKFISKKDSGDGCLIEEIVAYFGQEADDIILSLMSFGEIYEIKPGKIKLLE